MAKVSIATWNLHQGVDKRLATMEATWRYLKRAINPTVALVQEADGIPTTPGGSIVERADDVCFETAVAAYAGHLEPLPEVTTEEMWDVDEAGWTVIHD
jgi:hypothetical protein